MSEVTVESLPGEVLVEVFKWLDTKSLKNVMLTCQEWEDYVRRSHQWTLTLPDPFFHQVADALLESVLMANRKFNEVMINGWPGMNSKTLEFFDKHGASIQELKISYNKLTNASIWCEVLNTMQNLKKVVIETIWEVSSNDVSDDELPTLPKLKTLELSGESIAMLKFFKKCQLLTLNIFFRNRLKPDHREGFWNFLATQQDLKELKFNSGGCAELFVAPVTKELVPFRLKKFSLTRLATNSINNLDTFMKLHKDTLEELELRGTLPGRFYEIALSLNHLKTLSLTVYNMPQDRLEVNESVTSLQLNYSTRDLLGARPFLDHLPNVRKLKLGGVCDYTFAKFIADNMKRLEELDINAVETNTFDGARFPALESLRIRQVDGPVNWGAFAMNNPRVNELWIGKPKYLDVPAITQNLNLRKLTIESSELNCNKKFFEVIRENCPELKSLQLNEKSLKVDVATVADIPGLRFRQF